jgi:hypothetical protein
MPGWDPGGASSRDAPGALGTGRAQSPTHRPRWFVLLASLTLFYGGVLLVASLETWREPHAPAHLPATQTVSSSEDPAESERARAREAITEKLAEVNARVVATHERRIRGNAAVSVPLALLMLFAAASMLSRDRRGRAIALTAGWVGIAYQLGTLWLTYPVVRDYATQASPLLAQLAALTGKAQEPSASPELVANIVIAFPVVMTLGAIGSSLVLIRYFGGRRGRVLYGLERAESRR